LKLLYKNLSLNRINNVRPLKFALGDYDGTASLHTSTTANIGTHSLVQRIDYSVSEKGKLIKIQKGDSIVKSGEADVPTVIKIDVEGAEFDVLKGMEKILTSTLLRIVQIEIHPKILPLFNATVEDIYGLMNAANFSVAFQQVRGTEIEVVFEKK
jgi:FkbM family methyltransferase